METMSDAPRHPTRNDGRKDWKAHWTAQELPWRTEPEIDKVRQRVLTGRQAVQPDPQLGVYPFKGMKLNRADVEWLLANLKDGDARGPINGRDEAQRERRGLDVRGAGLSGGQA